MNPMMCQRCHSVLETEKRPKDIMMMRTILLVLLLTIIYCFFFSCYSSWLPCFPQSIKLSLTATVAQFISKKAFLILLSDFILLFLGIDFNLCGSSDLMNNLYDEYLMRLGNFLLSPSDAILTEPHIVEEKIAVEEGFKNNNIYDDLFASMQDDQPPVHERHGEDLSRRVQTLDDNQLMRQGWLALEDQPWQSYFVEVEDVADEKDMDVVVVKEVIIEEINPVGTKDEFEGLTIDELEPMFKEFIKRQKRNIRWESLQFVMV